MLKNRIQIRRALITVSDKEHVVDLARALHRAGAEIVATGKTAKVISDAGIPIVPIEKISGSPEAFQGRMKTLSFPVCSGILYRRGDTSDERDLKDLSIRPIDCVVVNFYPFEKAAARPGVTEGELVEEIDIGGPTLVRAAAKNAPDVVVLTSPAQYTKIIEELTRVGGVSAETSNRCAAEAWDRVLEYDLAIDRVMGTPGKVGQAREHIKHTLRYGENPHQTGELEVLPDSPIAWPTSQATQLTTTEISYNNVLDLSAAYGLACDLVNFAPEQQGVVIVKHNNPCGVATASSQLTALQRAWEGDSVSAFGGVLVFTHPIEEEVARWLSDRFVELVAAPGLERDGVALKTMLPRRKNLKAVAIRRFGEIPRESAVWVPGGILHQSADVGLSETLKSVTRSEFPQPRERLARFGIAVTRALKSNAIALVREIRGEAGGFQLVGAGQGQPNRIEALEALAIPRARKVLAESSGTLGDCVMISDAFFPFRDTVDAAHRAGIRAIIQPGGSIKDAESIAACDEHGIAMAFTGIRHFRH